MKICGISDIHGNLYNGVPECDVLCICGDIIPINIQRQNDASSTWWSRRFVKWASELPCKKVIVVPGNHDFYLEDIYNDGKEAWTAFKEIIKHISKDKVKILVDELYEYEGIAFYGTPWIEPITFQEGRWAFEYPSNNLEDKPFEKIPKCNVLLTHDNPNYNKVLDHYSFGQYDYHLFGHWHNGTAYNFMQQYNCSLLDDNYNFKKNLEIVTIDIMTKEEKQKVEQEFLEKLIYLSKTDEIADFLKTFIVPESLEEDNAEWDTNYSSLITGNCGPEYDDDIREEAV